MPVTGSNNAEKGPGGGGRTTFRPPWVKETGAQSTPAATNKAPWAKKPDTSATSKENGQPTVKEAKLQSREIKVPVMTTKLKPVPPPLKPKEERRDSNVSEKSDSDTVADAPVKREGKLEKPKLRHVEAAPKEKTKTPNRLPEQPKLRPVLEKTPKVEEKAPPPFERKLSAVADRKVPPPPPPPNGAPPPPPPMAGLKAPQDFQKKPLSDKQKEVLDKLKQRPRRRPDWSEMMKEVEDGKKLRHVECNDRSKPILTTKSMTKVSGQFVYETEKANVHNALLKQIQGGICLKPTKTNDRSKPFLEGLRKFRRQMTIEEQIQKSESKAVLNEGKVEDVEESEDEMDDIDKLRDDLQSTKQMLALELRNKEAQERENKLLLAKIANLEAELEREKSKTKSDTDSTAKTDSVKSSAVADDALVNSLKKDAEEARKTCKELEKKYQQSAEQLDGARAEIEEHKRIIANLEKKLAHGATDSRRASVAVTGKESSPEPEIESSESESDEDEEKKAERAARRLGREVKMLQTKLQKIKDKQAAAQKERTALKEAMKKNQALLKEETKRYKKLQKEVDKMAAMLKDVDEEDEDAEEKDEDEEEEVEEEEEEEEETEEETETEESEEESGSETESESEDEDASNEDKKSNLEPRVKKHEGRLNALKKGNYLLQTNVDRLLDEVNKMREQSAQLQRDLDSVLSELG